MIKKIVKYAVLLICSLVSGHEYNICGNNNLNIDKISLSPDPPHIGNTLLVHLEGNANIDVVEPTIELDLSILGINLANLHVNVCDTNHCPIYKGDDYSLEFNYTLPEKNPGSLPIDVKLDVKDHGNQVGCYTLETHVVKNTKHLTQNSPDNDIYWLFNHWKNYYRKQYRSVEEEVEKYHNFWNNTQYLLLHNSNHITLSHNKYSDQSRTEYRSKLGYRASKSLIRSTHILLSNISLPTEVDWRSEGAVTPVKNQGQCGSCWSFSTTGAMEGAYYIKTGDLVSFSEEELVACDHVDQGCNGGEMDDAFEWIHNNSGLCSDNSYPYSSGSGTVNSCRTCKPVKNSAVTGFVDVHPSEQALQIAVAQQPVAIGIEADHMSFQFYSGGVYSGNCGNNLDHGVLLVGYGSENGEDYWIVKNSWGDSWGNNGYIYIARGNGKEGGECGIHLSASYPVL